MTKDEIQRLQEMKDEDIDYSDIPKMTDAELKSFRRGRDIGLDFREVGRRNLETLARIVCDEEKGSDIAVAAAEALIARTLPQSHPQPQEDTPTEYGEVSI